MGNYDILTETLKLMTTGNEIKCNEICFKEYARFLIDVLCEMDAFIGGKEEFVVINENEENNDDDENDDDAKEEMKENENEIKWSKETEDEIIRRLFGILSRKNVKSDDILEEIQEQNEELAAMIIQYMSRKQKHENLVTPQNIQYIKHK